MSSSLIAEDGSVDLMGAGGNEWMGRWGPQLQLQGTLGGSKLASVPGFLEGKQQQVVKNSFKTKQNSALETRLFYRKRKSFHHSKSINFAGARVFFSLHGDLRIPVKASLI